MTPSSDARDLQIRKQLLDWFALNRRDLPWRMSRNPYEILVSEVMLQQTQVDRVLPYFERWLSEYPTVEALASASTAGVIRSWSGLGYNRRAVNLQRTARAVVDEFDGEFPPDVQTLMRLPGIGPYTAGAICAFAFEQDVAFLDTNIRRVMHRLFVGSEYPERTATDSELLAHALTLVQGGHGWIINQALIEFGALLCTQRKPACLICPLRNECTAFPLIQSAIAGIPRGKRLKDEGVFEGSNRQYRGRIVNRLRASHALTLAELGPEIKSGFASEDYTWLYGLIGDLARDGLLTIAEPNEEYDASSPDPDLVVSLPD